jgi:hypothetical protein
MALSDDVIRMLEDVPTLRAAWEGLDGYVQRRLRKQIDDACEEAIDEARAQLRQQLRYAVDDL